MSVGSKVASALPRYSVGRQKESNFSNKLMKDKIITKIGRGHANAGPHCHKL
ncbi:hypothetical protein LguiA_034045 [Lonicera macranthoides]